MEVGPLARYIVGDAKGTPEIKAPVDKLLHDLDLPLDELFSPLGRTAARGLEVQHGARLMRHFQDKLIRNIKARDRSTAMVGK